MKDRIISLFSSIYKAINEKRIKAIAVSAVALIVITVLLGGYYIYKQSYRQESDSVEDRRIDIVRDELREYLARYVCDYGAIEVISNESAYMILKDANNKVDNSGEYDEKKNANDYIDTTKLLMDYKKIDLLVDYAIDEIFLRYESLEIIEKNIVDNSAKTIKQSLIDLLGDKLNDGQQDILSNGMVGIILGSTYISNEEVEETLNDIEKRTQELDIHISESARVGVDLNMKADETTKEQLESLAQRNADTNATLLALNNDIKSLLDRINEVANMRNNTATYISSPPNSSISSTDGAREDKTKNDINSILKKISELERNNIATMEKANLDISSIVKRVDALEIAMKECFQSVSNGKALLASALTDKGVITDAMATFDQLSSNISQIGINTTVIPSDILIGKLAYTNNGYITGTMDNIGEVNATIKCDEIVNIPSGYTLGGQIKAASLSSQTQATATSSDISFGKTAWINGMEIIGRGAGGLPIATIPISVLKSAGKISGGTTRTVQLPEAFKGIDVMNLYSLYGSSASFTTTSETGWGNGNGSASVLLNSYNMDTGILTYSVSMNVSLVTNTTSAIYGGSMTFYPLLSPDPNKVSAFGG